MSKKKKSKIVRNVFRVNKNITIELGDEKMVIYVNDKIFLTCLKKYYDFTNVCTKLKSWAENNYDLESIKPSLSYPLLKKLYEMEESFTKSEFKKHIKKGLSCGIPSIMNYIFEENYYRYLDQEELLDCIDIILNINSLERIELLKIVNNFIHSYLSEHDLSTAIEIRKIIINQYPENFKEWQNLGHLYKNIDDYENAIFAYKKALEINPSDSLSKLYIGKMFFKMGEKSKAEEIFWEVRNQGFSILKYLDNDEKKLILKEFKVNEYITLKLEGGKTNIYVKNQLFDQCKFLLLNIPVDRLSTFDEIDSIDEAAENLDHSLERRGTWEYKIPPEVEFWGHCSNLQVWAEMDYDTRILHRNIAFPLLRKLSHLGDIRAKKIFKKEIIKRFVEGNDIVNTYLIEEGYLEFLNTENFKRLFVEFLENENYKAIEFLYSRQLINLRKYSKDEAIELIFDLNYDFNDFIKGLLKQSSKAGQMILELLGAIPGGLLENTEDLPQKLYKKGIIKIFLYGNNDIREYMTPRAGSGKFNYLDFACRDKGESISLLNEIFQNQDIRALRFLESHHQLYIKYHLSKDEIKDLIFDSNYNYQEFFRTLVSNKSDFRTIAIRFIKDLVERGDIRAKDILKKEVIKRLKASNLEDLRYLISSKELEMFTNEELEIISFKQLEEQRFLNNFSQNISFFDYIFSLLKGFIERGFESKRDLLKSIFLREFEKRDSPLLKWLISKGYLDFLTEKDKKEIINYLIKIGNLNVFLELGNRFYINLLDFQNDLLTPHTELNHYLMIALEDPNSVKNFAFRLLEWFAEKGSEDAKDFLKNQINKWIKTGPPEIISFLKDKYQLKEFFCENRLREFILDKDSFFIDNILKGLSHKFYSIRKDCFSIFLSSLPFLDQQQRDQFITIFSKKVEYRERKMPDTAFQGIEGLLILGAFNKIRNLLIRKGYYSEFNPSSLREKIRNYTPFPSTYRSYYDDYEEEDEYLYHTLEFLILFIDSRGRSINESIKDEEFKILHKFISRAGEIIDIRYILNNLSKSDIQYLEDYLVKILNAENDPQAYRKILEFINYCIIALDNLNAKDFFFRVLNSYTDFKRRNKKIYLDNLLINYIFQIHNSLGDDFLDVLLKLFDEDQRLLGSFIYDSLSPEHDVSDEMRAIAFKTLVLLIKSRNKKTLSLLLREQILIPLERECLLRVFAKMDEDDLEFFFYGLTKLSEKDYYHYFEEIGDETYLITLLKESLDKRRKNEKMNCLKSVINIVTSKYPDLFEFLIESEFFEDFSELEIWKLLENPDKLFIKSILLYLKKHFWRNEVFDNFSDQVSNNELNCSFDRLIQKLLDFFLDMLHHFNYEFYSITPAINFFKKFGQATLNITFEKLKEWLNDEEYPYYQFLTSLINNDFLEIMNRDQCSNKLRELETELVDYLKTSFDSQSYTTGYNALVLIRIYKYTDNEDFLINLLKNLPLNLRENVKNSILNVIECNEKKHNVFHKKLDSDLETTALELVKIIEEKLDVENLKHVIVRNKKHFVINNRLDLSEKEIYDIEEVKGLQQLTELKILNLSSNFITEIKGLDTLINLESLNLDATLNEYKLIISELKGIEKLVNLKELSIRHHKISDIKGLENLTSLERLMLDFNQIKDIKHLEKLNNLKVLNLEYNKISEIRGLENLQNLFYLNLSHNQIKEIKGLNYLRNLESLWLDDNEISELKGLEYLYNLQKISVDHQRPGYRNSLSLDKSKSYFEENGSKYVVHCLKKVREKINGTMDCPGCDAIVYSVWDHCPICYTPLKMEKKQ